MTSVKLEARRREFRSFVWNHGVDAFQAKFDIRAELAPDEVKTLLGVLSKANLESVATMAVAVADVVKRKPQCVRLLLQLTGLTRNKILQDVKAHCRQGGDAVSTSSPESLFRSALGIELASEYLARQLIRVYGHVKASVTADMLEVANQATWLGYIRQERAKRQGHEAEYRIACLLRDCGLPFEPVEKVENPLCRDVQIGGVSYDLVSSDAANAFVRVKSTVHTANIGQYGESKDHLEIQEAASAIAAEKNGNQVTLLAFIDGVGFESNSDGLNGVLMTADEFCQFRTIWKAAVIVTHKLGGRIDVALPPAQHGVFQEFVKARPVTLVDRKTVADNAPDWIVAGDAMVRVSGIKKTQPAAAETELS